MSTTRARALRKRMGAPEAKMWNALRLLKPMGFHFRRQVPLGRYYADFACHGAKLVIEIDGDTHASSAAINYDANRDAFIRGQGYDVLRIPNGEVMHNIAGVMELVLVTLEQQPESARRASPHPIPPHRGEG